MVAVTKRGGSYYCQHGNEDGKCEVCYYEEWWPANKKSPDCKFDAKFYGKCSLGMPYCVTDHGGEKS